MAINKVIYGGETLLDLTADTVSEDKLLSGATAHNKAGNKIQGKAQGAKPEQSKTVEITANGDYPVTPDVGKVLSEVIAKVNVPAGGGGGGIEWCHVVIDGAKDPCCAFYGYGTGYVTIGDTNYDAPISKEPDVNGMGWNNFPMHYDIYVPKYSIIHFTQGGPFTLTGIAAPTSFQNKLYAFSGKSTSALVVYVLSDGNITLTFA